MPWYHTSYLSEGTRGGRYASSLDARDLAEAKRLIKRRSLGEQLEDMVPSNKRRHVLPSEWMRKRPSPENDKRVFHALCWMAHLALKSGVAIADQLLGDQGLVHEWCHMRTAAGPTRAELIAMAEAIERRIPGFVER